jgi:hypothetical protein
MMLLGAILVIIVGLVIWTAIDAPNNLQIDYRRSRRDWPG